MRTHFTREGRFYELYRHRPRRHEHQGRTRERRGRDLKGAFYPDARRSRPRGGRGTHRSGHRAALYRRGHRRRRGRRLPRHGGRRERHRALCGEPEFCELRPAKRAARAHCASHPPRQRRKRRGAGRGAVRLRPRCGEHHRRHARHGRRRRRGARRQAPDRLHGRGERDRPHGHRGKRRGMHLRQPRLL